LMSGHDSDNLSKRELFNRSGFSGKTALFLATWCGTGLLPFAPGTFGTLGALPLAVALLYCPVPFRAVFLLIFMAVAVWASGRSQSLLGRADPPEVVIDEVAGFLVATWLLRPTWANLAGAFLFFRLFDILKPFPVGFLDRRLKGGIGIVLDDIAAGGYAWGCLELVHFILH